MAASCYRMVDFTMPLPDIDVRRDRYGFDSVQQGTTDVQTASNDSSA
jgi:hypothetical protein